jgi:phage baseplate assembly protein W
MDAAFPYHLDDHGRTAHAATADEHVRQMLEQLLFTRPGERVNRPDFGCGLGDLIFGPNTPELAAALQVTISAAVQQWLGDLIQLQAIAVDAVDERLVVNLAYVVSATGVAAGASFALSGVP